MAEHREWLAAMVRRLARGVADALAEDAATLGAARPGRCRRTLLQVLGGAPDGLVPGAEAERCQHHGQSYVVERSAAESLLQPRVYPQLVEGPCGYHALHNAARAVAALVAPGDREAARLWRAAGTAASYYRTFHGAREELLRNPGVSPSGTVHDGVVERGHMMHLVARWPRAAALAPLLTAAPEFTAEAAEPLERALRRAAGEGGCHALVVGAVYHWVAVVAASPAGGGPPEVAVLDSYNRPSLRLGLDRSRAYAAAHAELRDDPVRQMFYVESRRRVAQWIDLVREAVQRGTDAREVYLRRQTHAMVRTFRALAVDRASDEELAARDTNPLPDLAGELRALREWRLAGGRAAPDAVARWAGEYYPPALILKRDLARVRQLGAAHLGALSRAALAEWAAAARAVDPGDDATVARVAAAAGELTAALALDRAGGA